LPETSASARELRAFAARQLAAAKIPRVVVAVDEIPAGATGKVQRNRLAELFAEELESALKSPPGEYTPPRTSVERLLADIWAAILHVERVGIRDRFYDLGGNSLLAVNMLSEVERKFGRGIPAGEFWTAPTLENLAAILIAAEPKKSSVMIPVQPSGRKPPLYYVLPGWFISEVELLSRYLGDDQPVYALVPDTRPGAGQHGMGSDEIVAECVAAIEATQRGGPYFVVGRSAGGLVALEIARKLGEHGNAVGLAGLLDTHYPGVIRHRLLPTPLRQIEFLMGDLLMTPRPQWRAHLLRMPWRALRRGWRTIWRLRLPSQIANQALATGLERVFHEAPEPYPGRITFFAAESSRHRGFLDRRLYWSQAAAMGLELHLTPGDHNMMVQEPHIRHFAEALQGCLDRASGIDAAGGRSRSSTGKFATHEATSVQSSARSDTRRLR
jgi:thioesterase domain-containing protein/acyl carrier protein